MPSGFRYFGLLILVLWCVFAPSRANGQNGALIIAGGGVSPQAHAIWQAIAGEGGYVSEILVISSGSADPERAGAEIVEILRSHGAKATLVPLSPLPNAFSGQGGLSAADPVWAKRARAARGFFFAGGAQGRIVDALAPDGRESLLLAAIREAHRGGAFVSGTSAGAAIMSRLMFLDPSGQLDLLARGPQGEDMGAGLGFLAQPWLVDQHFLARDRHLRLLSGLCQAAGSLRGGLGIDEGTALQVRGDEARVIGASGVIVMRVIAAQSCAPLNAEANITLAYPGDAISLRDGSVVPGAPLRTLNAKSPAQEIQAVPQAGSLRAALARLADTGEESLAVAMRAEEGGQIAPLGWLTRVRLGPASLAWGPGQSPSVSNAVLEIAPFGVQLLPAPTPSANRNRPR